MNDATAQPTVAQFLQAVRAGDVQPPGSAALIGMEVVDVGDGTATFRLAPSPRHDNGVGFVHGGILAMLMDFAAAGAVSDVPVSAQASTASLNLVFLRPVPLDAGPVRAEASLVHRGGRSSVAQVRVVGEHGELYALATGTVVAPRP